MATRKVEVPEELLALLRQSRLGTRPDADQVPLGLAIHLFQEGLISVGRAAELASEPRATFELLLGDLGIPPVRYDLDDYQSDFETIQRARGKRL
jgi:predicted HTH domain antitoxin